MGPTVTAVRILPGTRLGALSVILIVTMPILILVGSVVRSTVYDSVPAGDSILDDIATRPGVAVTMLLALGCGLAAGVVGVLSIVRHAERSLLALLSVACSGLLLLFLMAEVVFPH